MKQLPKEELNITQANDVRMIPLKNGYKIWTKTSQQGSIPILCVHGGPGATHESFECFEQFLGPKGFQVIMYDQLDSYYSDKPNDPTLWTIERFRDEIEEVRLGLGLEKIFLYGYSWGAILAIEYALSYQQNLQGLIINGFSASADSFEKHMQQLRKTLPVVAQDIFNQLEPTGEAGNALWQETMEKYFYPRYFCGLNPFPEAFNRAISHLNWQLCHHFFGKNDFVVEGALKGWNRWADLPKITIPSLIVIGEDDLCSVDDAEKMSRLMGNASTCVITNAKHVPFYENQIDFFDVLLNFLCKTKSVTDLD